MMYWTKSQVWFTRWEGINCTAPYGKANLTFYTLCFTCTSLPCQNMDPHHSAKQTLLLNFYVMPKSQIDIFCAVRNALSRG